MHEECHLWTCEQRFTAHCKATVTTDQNDEVIRGSRIGHNHEPARNKSDVLRTLHEIRTDAASNMDMICIFIVLRFHYSAFSILRFYRSAFSLFCVFQFCVCIGAEAY